MKWTLWENMRVGWKGYKRKDGSQQRSHHERYGCDEQRGHNNDNPYVQDYTPKTHSAD